MIETLKILSWIAAIGFLFMGFIAASSIHAKSSEVDDVDVSQLFISLILFITQAAMFYMLGRLSVQ